MMEMYVFTGGATAQKVLNALALFFNSEERLTLIGIISIVAVFMTAIRFILTRDHNNILAWFATMLLIPALLLTPKSDMIIIDASQLGRTYTVSNVPLGIAVPAHYSTVFMHGMSTVIDKIFRMPNDQAYSKSGMLFGARIMGLASSIGVQNAELKGIWQQYLQNCIRPDIIVNTKYTWQEFANSGNIFEFLKNNRPSPLRRIGLNNDFVTCQDALPQIEALFDAEVDNSWGLIGTQSQGARWAKDEAMLQNSLQNSMRDLANISKSASDIMKQNIAINAVREGLYSGAASMDAVGAALNYTQTKNDATTTSSLLGAGLVAKNWLPIAHSVVILLIICTAIPVFLVCFIPGMSLKILKGYAGGYFYLATWPMFFTFINMIMTYSLASATEDMLGVNAGAINLSSSNQIELLHNKYSAIAGLLMMAVPLIAAKTLSGGMAMASGIMQQLSGTANGISSRNAGALASGDMEFGNLQMDNQTMNNRNGNKHDMGFMDNNYGATVQRMDGTSVTQNAAGGNVYNSSGAVSKTAWDVNSSQSQTKALQQAVNDSEAITAQNRTAYNQSTATSSDALASLSNNASNTSSYGTGTQDTNTANLNRSLSSMDSVVAEHAKATGQSTSEARKELTDSYFGYDTSISGKTREFQLGFAKVQASASLSHGGKNTTSDISSEESSTSTTDREAQSRQEQFNTAMGDVKQYSSNENTSTMNAETRQAAQNFNESFRKTEDLAETLDLSHSNTQSYSAALQASQNGTLGINTDLKQEFQGYIEQKRPNNVETIMNGYGETVRDERDALFEGFMAEKFQDYNPQLKTALDGSQVNRPPEAMTGASLEDKYNSGATLMTDAVKPSHEKQLGKIVETYENELPTLFDRQQGHDQKTDSLKNQQALREQVVNNISSIPEQTTPIESPKPTQREPQEPQAMSPLPYK